MKSFFSPCSAPLLVLLLATTAPITAAVAQTATSMTEEGATVAAVQVEGNQRVESATITSYLSLKVGMPYSAAKADESVKNLFATGLFSDVSVRPSGNQLLVSVKENPLVSQVAFEGNKSLSTESLQKEVALKPRSIFTPAQALADAQRISQLYIRDGRYAAKVVPKTITQDQNRVDVVFEIAEGEPTYVRAISFTGNKVFTNSTLKEVVQTRENAWYRFLSNSDSYDPNRLTYDQELLSKFYRQNGYAAVSIGAPVAELTPEQDGFFVTVPIVEGARYKFGKVDLQINLPEVPKDQLESLITLHSGDWFNAKDIESVVGKLSDKLGSLGYALAEVEAQEELDTNTLTAAVTFVVKESPKIFVESIAIQGNSRTADEVIRRELRLAEGDVFNTAKLKRSRERLKNLNFFEKVDIRTEPGSASDRSKLVVDVSEKSTGEVTLGGGYSTSDQLLANFSVREKNLMGEGKDLRLSTQLSTRRQEYVIGYTEPYFLDRNMTGGFDLFRNSSDLLRQSSYQEEEVGFALRTGYEIDERWSQQLRYRLSQNKIGSVASDASRYIKAQEGTNVTSQVSQTLLYDRRDNKIQPNSGYFVRLTNDLAGFGGGVRYLQSRLESTTYNELTEGVVLAIGAEGGAITGLGQDVRISDRFFLGGQSFPGFRSGGLGPRDTELNNGANDALGGEYYYTAKADLGFPLGLPNDFGIRGHLFTVAGTLTGVEETGPTIQDDAALRASAGFGIAWESPFGPIRVDYAKPFVKKSFDRSENILFSFGTQF